MAAGAGARVMLVEGWGVWSGVREAGWPLTVWLLMELVISLYDMLLCNIPHGPHSRLPK